MKRNAFSVTTMPASTSTPMAIAMPARLMMFDEMPGVVLPQERQQIRVSGCGRRTIRIDRRAQEEPRAREYNQKDLLRRGRA
jgi:hypothetical protein